MSTSGRRTARGMREQRLDLRGEQHRGAGAGVEQRAHAERVASQDEPGPGRIEEAEGEVAGQPRGKRVAERAVRRQDERRVRRGRAHVGGPGELRQNFVRLSSRPSNTSAAPAVSSIGCRSSADSGVTRRS